MTDAVDRLAQALLDVWNECEDHDAGNLPESLSYALGVAAKTLVAAHFPNSNPDTWVELQASDEELMQRFAAELLVKHRPGYWEANHVRQLCYLVALVA